MSDDEVETPEIQEAMKNESGEPYFELGKKKRITVREFKGTLLVDIREYYDDNGTMKPGRKGISLTIEQWHALADLVGDVGRIINEKVGLEFEESSPRKKRKIDHA